MNGAAVVTGAARRIGLRIAERLASAGYAVVLECSPCSLHSAREAADKIIGQGGRAAALAHDLSVESELSRVIAEARAIFGPLTLLVNNASVFEDDAAASFDLELWDRHFGVNLRAPAVLSRDFARELPPGMEAAIVNIIDQRVFRLTPQYFSYTLSKAALWTATRTMAQAFAPQKIRVNAVGPGPALPNERQGEAGFAREVEGLPLRRSIAPDDIADAVLYLAGARNVTGQMIAVDAGQHLGWLTPDIVR
ncbi:SDR family oxidoreductase [Methylocapsa palsarum]|uniref:NAD(P)-dependent dehydrogenase, short-chain alcohol dehydrogenase family n=1 Tax=Methylocapsa palsarum TaxID=1612308 RepID=A0A1I3WU89_9HYPH|nr:SDR family oxidoreductase [Methylocapsa palsarum]SFK11194.1 NAD(P)-dependent dehydrogenase, short-chain alcohol dehydrogenase family [Methylocapsa palsarum]